nr:MAG TPA: hypothetical protein [Caudoviricetes sp.]
MGYSFIPPFQSCISCKIIIQQSKNKVKHKMQVFLIYFYFCCISCKFMLIFN